MTESVELKHVKKHKMKLQAVDVKAVKDEKCRKFALSRDQPIPHMREIQGEMVIAMPFFTRFWHCNTHTVVCSPTITIRSLIKSHFL